MSENLIFWKIPSTPIQNRGIVPKSTNSKLMLNLCQKFNSLYEFLKFMQVPFLGEKYTKRGSWHWCNILRLSKLSNKEVLQWLSFLKSSTTPELFYCICEHVVEVFIEVNFFSTNFRDLQFLLITDDFCLPTWSAICKWGRILQSSKAYYNYLFERGFRFTPLALNIMFNHSKIRLFVSFVRRFFTPETRGIAHVFLEHVVAHRKYDFIDYYFFCRQSSVFDLRHIEYKHYKFYGTNLFFHELIIGLVRCKLKKVKIGENVWSQTIVEPSLCIKSIHVGQLWDVVSKYKGKNGFCKILFILRSSVHDDPVSNLFNIMFTDFCGLQSQSVISNPMGLFKNDVSYFQIKDLETLTKMHINTIRNYNDNIKRMVLQVKDQKEFFQKYVNAYCDRVIHTNKKVNLLSWLPSNVVPLNVLKNSCVLYPYNLNEFLNINHNQKSIEFDKACLTITDVQIIFGIFTHISSFLNKF